MYRLSIFFLYFFRLSLNSYCDWMLCFIFLRLFVFLSVFLFKASTFFPLLYYLDFLNSYADCIFFSLSLYLFVYLFFFPSNASTFLTFHSSCSEKVRGTKGREGKREKKRVDRDDEGGGRVAVSVLMVLMNYFFLRISL